MPEDPPNATWATRLATLEVTVAEQAETQQQILDALAAAPGPPEDLPPEPKNPADR